MPYSSYSFFPVVTYDGEDKSEEYADKRQHDIPRNAVISKHRSYPSLQYGFFTMNETSKDLRRNAVAEIVPMIPNHTSYSELRRYELSNECRVLWAAVQRQVTRSLFNRGIFGRRVKDPHNYKIEAYRTENTTALKVRDDWLGVAVPLFDLPVPIRFAGADEETWEPDEVLYFTETGFKLPGTPATVLYVIFRLEESG